MTPCTQALPQPGPRSVSIDTLPLAPEALGSRPGPRAAATGARAVWWQLRSLRPAAAAAVAILAMTPLLGALWLGSRSPEAPRDDSRFRLTAPKDLPAIPRPSDADHALRLRLDKPRPSAPPEGFYGAAGRGGPIEDSPAPEPAPAPGGLMAPPPEPAWRPEGRLQPVAFTGAQGTGGAGGGAAGQADAQRLPRVVTRSGASAPRAARPPAVRKLALASPTQPVWGPAAAVRQPTESRVTETNVYAIETDLHAAYLTNGPGATDEWDDPDGWRWRPQTFGQRDRRQNNGGAPGVQVIIGQANPVGNVPANGVRPRN